MIHRLVFLQSIFFPGIAALIHYAGITHWKRISSVLIPYLEQARDSKVAACRFLFA